MDGLSIMQYKDAYSVAFGERMLIYGLTMQQARDFRNVYCVKAAGAESARFATPRSDASVERHPKVEARRGRKLTLERYLPIIESYLSESACPTIKELDGILLREGASYSSTTSIRNALHRLGHDIPMKASADKLTSVGDR